jgi:AcrR family transcriptional regulator
MPEPESLTAPSRPAMRSDAEQNRARILDAARAALAESGEASLQSITKRAGVGQGTMYRHFPNREALVMAVHRQDVAQLVDAAPDLLKRHPPFEALRLWFDQLADYGRIKHGLGSALHTVMRTRLGSEGYGPVIGAIALLLDAGKEAGDIRPDVDAEEVLLLVGFLWRIDPDADREARARHMLTLVMDGLRHRPPAPTRVRKGRSPSRP